jgi:hypothetical protein
MSPALRSISAAKLTMVPLLPSSEYIFWADREIRFASIRPLGRIVSYKAIIAADEHRLSETVAFTEVERGLANLSEIVPFEERFIFHVQAAIVRATFRPRPSTVPNTTQVHDNDFARRDTQP